MAQLLLGLLAGGDVDDVAADPHDTAVLNLGPADRAHPDPLTVRADQAQLEVVSLAFGHQPLERRFQHRFAVRVEGGDRRGDVGRLVGPVQAVDAVDLVGPRQLPGRNVVVPAPGLADLLSPVQEVGQPTQLSRGTHVLGDVPRGREYALDLTSGIPEHRRVHRHRKAVSGPGHQGQQRSR